MEKMKETIQSLEKATVFYKDQNDVLLGQNENLKKEVQEAKTHSQESDDKNLLLKYKKKCDMVDELVKKQEKMSAQIRRKDWEIENYQKKLVTAFEAGMSIATKEGPSGEVKYLILYCIGLLLLKCTIIQFANPLIMTICLLCFYL